VRGLDASGEQKTEVGPTQQIDLGTIKTDAQPAAQTRVRVLVDMARAEAHEMMGERKQALAFAERHLVVGRYRASHEIA
jgi:hypothetical protein